MKNILVELEIMKYLVLLLAITLVSCKPKHEKSEIPCLVRVKYIDNEKYFNPPAIKVDFVDTDTTIGISAKNEMYTDIILNSSGKNSGEYFWLKPNYYAHLGDTTSLYFVLGLSDSIGTTNMDPIEIESFLLKGGISFVKGNDTLQVMPCKED